MMAFRTVKAALTSILGVAAVGQWTTTGYQGQSVAAESVLNNLRRVTVYYSQGIFPLGRSNAVAGPVRHEMTMRVELMVSANAQADLTALDNPSSTAAQRKVALAAALDAEVRADAAFDEFADLIWNVLMRPANYGLGLGQGVVSDRWISQARKGDPQPRGDLVILTGSMDYTCAAMEIATGTVPVLGTSIDATVSVKSETGGTVDPAGEGAKATQP